MAKSELTMIPRNRAPGSDSKRSRQDDMIYDNLRILFRTEADNAWQKVKDDGKIPVSNPTQRPLNPETGRPWDCKDINNAYCPCPVPVEQADGSYRPCGYEPKDRRYGIQADAQVHMEKEHFGEWIKEETPGNEFRAGWVDVDGKLRPPMDTKVKLPFWGHTGDDPGRKGIEKAVYEAREASFDEGGTPDEALIAQADKLRDDTNGKRRPGRPRKQETDNGEESQ